MLKIRYKANTPDQRALGLTLHPPLKEGEALLMEYRSPEMVSIWNRGVGYDIDVGFFDEKGELMRVHSLKADNGENQTPLVFSTMPTKWVLETRRGELSEHNPGKSINLIVNETIKK